MAAPGMTTAAPASPPMASSAMRTLLGIKVLETWSGAVLNERGRKWVRHEHGGRSSATPHPDRGATIAFCYPETTSCPQPFAFGTIRPQTAEIHKKHIKIKQIIRPLKPRSQTPRAP